MAITQGRDLLRPARLPVKTLASEVAKANQQGTSLRLSARGRTRHPDRLGLRWITVSATINAALTTANSLGGRVTNQGSMRLMGKKKADVALSLATTATPVQTGNLYVYHGGMRIADTTTDRKSAECERLRLPPTRFA